MKLMSLALSALLFGCSFESVDNGHENMDSDSTPTNSYYSAGGDLTNNCPPPVTYTVIIGGKPTTQTYIEPCLAPKTIGNYSSDPAGWGNDNYDDGNYQADKLPNLKQPPPGDPIPR